MPEGRALTHALHQYESRGGHLSQSIHDATYNIVAAASGDSMNTPSSMRFDIGAPHKWKPNVSDLQEAVWWFGNVYEGDDLLRSGPMIVLRASWFDECVRQGKRVLYRGFVFFGLTLASGARPGAIGAVTAAACGPDSSDAQAACYGSFRDEHGVVMKGTKVFVQIQWAKHCLSLGKLVPTDEWEIIGECKTPKTGPIPIESSPFSACNDDATSKHPEASISATTSSAKREVLSPSPWPPAKRRSQHPTSVPPKPTTSGVLPLATDFGIPYVFHWYASVTGTLGPALPEMAVSMRRKLVEDFVPAEGGEFGSSREAQYVVVPLEPGELGT
ncbi:hypothetical protein DB88DRAFT_538067 [Papiliotrema laurentii]|uniref:Uncharacterized protein n=1 Tax=Papiliotrema laurentii TaxID=5418 RepID=A0AAD9L7Q8_PAPLA|nr:hypothetical protein DB88DRAFT_538067 [Papiliotrema laurentii]